MRPTFAPERPQFRGPAAAAFLAAASWLFAPAAGWGRSSPHEFPPALPEDAVVAILPPENLSGSSAPLKEIRRSLRAALEARSVRVLDEEELESFMASHRMRYAGGLATEMGRAFLDETRTAAVVITSVDLYEESETPKLAITSRLVSTGERTTILWMDSVEIAGNETPGLFGLKRVHDVNVLRYRAVAGLAESLAVRLGELGAASAGRPPSPPRAQRRFRPRTFHRSPRAAPEERRIRVAVMPFRSDAGREDAGDLVALQFVRRLVAHPEVEVLEPGVVREVLLRARLVQSEGISLPQADLIRELLDADLVVAGRVAEWQDAPGDGAVPRVAFSAQGIDTRTRRVAWTAATGHRGDRGVFFFDFGRVFTANALASETVLGVVERALESPRRAERR